MTKTSFRRLVALAATGGLAATLAACGPRDAQQNKTAAPLLSTQAASQPGWSMDDLAGVDPAFLQTQAGPLPQALPMRTAYRGGYDEAPAYDYGPGYYDGGYVTDAGADDYRWLALATSLSGMLGDAPPDYAFGYDGVQPWAWQTGDRYLRYAEPIDGGYRYYYYEPDSYTPFLVSDPYYSYGYRGDRLVTIYDRSGRVIDARRAERQRRAAQDYFARARQLYTAGHREPHAGVPAVLWQRHRDTIARAPQQWQQARTRQVAWQQWDAKNEPKLHRDWAGEALVRREAERSFAGWQKADFKTPAPKFYSQQQRQAQLRQVAEIRRDRQVAQPQKVPQRQQVDQPQAAQQQQRVAADRNQQATRQADAVRGRDQRQLEAQRTAQQRQAGQQQHNAAQQRTAQAGHAAQQRQAQAQRAPARQQARGEQANHAAAARQDQQRQQQAQRAAQQHQQQALRAAGERRQQAAREHQLEAQRATQQRAAQAQQARRGAQQRTERAAQQQQAQAAQAVQAAQRQVQRAQAAGQQRQAHAKQAAQRQTQQAHAAQQQARQAAQRQAQQAHAAAPRASAPLAKGHGGGSGKDHGHKPG